MLPFQKEQDGGNLPAQSPNAAGMASGNGADQSPAQEYLTVAEHGKRTRKSTVALAILFVVGLLCLILMIKKSTPATVSAAEVQHDGAQIEAAISRLTGVKSEVFGRMDEIVDKFYEFSDVHQVKTGELSRNPFEFELYLDGAKQDTEVEVVSQEDIETLWKQRIKQKLERLGLVSIMQSERGNCCMIGSDIFYEGDSVEGFKISEIGPSFVKLKWEPTADSSQVGPRPESVVEVILRLSE
ncbi:MAG: hypothetical protein ACYSWO_05235 [Planctomycetota bacterium]|jgi:hypothetical protein